MYSLAKNKPWLLALLSGVLLAASFPPSPLGFLSYVAFVPLFVLLEGLPRQLNEDIIFLPLKKFWIILFRMLTLQFIWRRKINTFKYERRIISGNAQAFRYTYFAFLVWNVLGCYWLTLTMAGANDIVEGLQYFAGGLLAILVNPMLMSLPWQVYSRIRFRYPPIVAALILAFAWVAFECLHFHWDLSWSWLTMGHSLSTYNALIQYSEFTGVLGLSLQVMIANVLLYAVFRSLRVEKRMNYKMLLVAVTWLLMPLAFYFILTNPSRGVFKAEGTRSVRVIQPSIDPYTKFERLTRSAQYKRFYELLTRPGIDSIDLAIFPETALTMPGGMDHERLLTDTLTRKLWAVVDSHKVSILGGAVELRIFDESENIPASATQRGDFIFDTYNAALMMRPDRRPEYYRKIKLVPFVERAPFLKALAALRKKTGIDLTMGFGGYGLPDSLTTLHMQDGTAIGTIICYESEFGEVVGEHVRRGAKLLVVITNDGWWSKSSGYVQHAYLSRLRAVEARRDIARSANTGRSLFVDAFGRMSHETSWYEITAIDKRMNLYSSMTFYVMYGDWLGWLCLILTGGFILLAFVRKPKL